MTLMPPEWKYLRAALPRLVLLYDLAYFYFRCRFACDSLPLRNFRLLQICTNLPLPAKAALLALASGVVELVNAQGNGVRLMVGIVMLVLAGGYVAIGCNVRKSPLVLSVAGLVVSAFFLSGVFGVVIAGVMALSVWFAVLYTKAVARERELRAKLEKLK